MDPLNQHKKKGKSKTAASQRLAKLQKTVDQTRQVLERECTDLIAAKDTRDRSERNEHRNRIAAELATLDTLETERATLMSTFAALGQETERRVHDLEVAKDELDREWAASVTAILNTLLGHQ
ncbi:hypothetical protein BC828DRAFT_372315 [Blastocladiella britannica]|nr:hypothetical protein BC828DRAFT_372315 [Blastocladiella britannica]